MQMCPTWTNIRGRSQELSFSGEGWWPSGISSFPGLPSKGNPGIVFFTPLPAYWWEIGSSPHYSGNYSRHLPRIKYDFGVILDPPKGVSGLSWRLSGKESACHCRRHGYDPWVGKIPWRRKWQPTTVFLPGKSHGQGDLAGYSLWDCKRVRHDLTTKQQGNG